MTALPQTLAKAHVLLKAQAALITQLQDTIVRLEQKVQELEARRAPPSTWGQPVKGIETHRIHFEDTTHIVNSRAITKMVNDLDPFL